MSMMYNPEDLKQFLKEEQDKEQEAKAAKNQTEMKKVSDTAKKAVINAQVAFECSQENKFEIEDLKRQIKRNKIVAIVAIVIAVICMSMVVAEGFSEMIRMLP